MLHLTFQELYIPAPCALSLAQISCKAWWGQSQASHDACEPCWLCQCTTHQGSTTRRQPPQHSQEYLRAGAIDDHGWIHEPEVKPRDVQRWLQARVLLGVPAFLRRVPEVALRVPHAFPAVKLK